MSTHAVCPYDISALAHCDIEVERVAPTSPANSVVIDATVESHGTDECYLAYVLWGEGLYDRDHVTRVDALTGRTVQRRSVWDEDPISLCI
jgi:hypothetical protein